MQIPLAAVSKPDATSTNPRQGSLEGGTNITISLYGHVQPDQYEDCNCFMYVYLEPVDTSLYIDRCATLMPPYRTTAA